MAPPFDDLSNLEEAFATIQERFNNDEYQVPALQALVGLLHDHSAILQKIEFQNAADRAFSGTFMENGQVRDFAYAVEKAKSREPEPLLVVQLIHALQLLMAGDATFPKVMAGAFAETLPYINGKAIQ